MAKNFYTTNAIYEYIIQNNYSDYKFAKENIWLMIYGNKESIPKIILVISAVNNNDFVNKHFSSHEIEIMNIAAQLADKSGLEYKVVRYPADEKYTRKSFEIQYIDYQTKRYSTINIDKLTALFQNNGIHTEPSKTSKYLNDKTASVFHQWQRDTLGKNVTASDIDLIKISNPQKPVVYELKRSIYPIETWEPYKDDFANFKLIKRFCDYVGADFKIVYNRRTKQPFFDDISKLKLFSFDADNEKATYVDTISLDDFFGGNL